MVDLASGQWLGEWILEDRLGEGGFAVVYRARHATSGAVAAVKVPTDPRLVAQLEVERARLTLEHPSIVATLEDVLSGEPPHLVLELVEGGSLRDSLADGALPPRRVVELLRDLGAALDHAHGEGVLHLDVKPENVLLDAEGKPHLTDFGAVGRDDMEDLRQSLSLSQELGVAGTPDYAAPEIRYGDGTIDRRADVYSLAVVAFELLTGRLPLGLDRPSELVPELSTAVDDALARGMTRDPQRRTLTAGELVTELERALVPGTGGAEPSPLPVVEPQPEAHPAPTPLREEAAPPPPRRRWRRWLGALVVSLLPALGAAPLIATFVAEEAQPPAHPRLGSLLERSEAPERVALLLPIEDLGAHERGWARDGSELARDWPNADPDELWARAGLDALYERAEREGLQREQPCEQVVQAVVPPAAGRLADDALLFLVDLPSYELRAATPTGDPLAERCAAAIRRQLASMGQVSRPLGVLPTVDAQARVANRSTAWFDAQLTAELVRELPRIPLRARAGLVPRLRSYGGDAVRALSVGTAIECTYDASSATLLVRIEDLDRGEPFELSISKVQLPDYDPVRDAQLHTPSEAALELAAQEGDDAVLAEALETARAHLYEDDPARAEGLLTLLRARGKPFDAALEPLLLLAQAKLDQRAFSDAAALYVQAIERHPGERRARDAYARASLAEASRLHARGKRPWYGNDDERLFTRALELLDAVRELELEPSLKAEIEATRARLEREL